MLSKKFIILMNGSCLGIGYVEILWIEVMAKLALERRYVLMFFSGFVPFHDIACMYLLISTTTGRMCVGALFKAGNKDTRKELS